jgi:hypothetical protein
MERGFHGVELNSAVKKKQQENCRHIFFRNCFYQSPRFSTGINDCNRIRDGLERPMLNSPKPFLLHGVVRFSERKWFARRPTVSGM